MGVVTICTGDSIAYGTGAAGADHTFAREGAPPGAPMDRFFLQSAAAAEQALANGDQPVVIVSAGANYPHHVNRLEQQINGLPEGTRVVILGLREHWPVSGGYSHLANIAPNVNNELRQIAERTGATFSETSIAFANRLPNGEVHGGYGERLRIALNDATGSQPLTGGVQTPEALPAAEQENDALTTTALRNWHIAQMQQALGVQITSELNRETLDALRTALAGSDAPLPDGPARLTRAHYEALAGVNPDMQALAALSRDNIRAIQAQCRDLGHPAGTFGAAGDGVDGLCGAYTLASIEAVIAQAGIGRDPGESLLAAFEAATARLAQQQQQQQGEAQSAAQDASPLRDVAALAEGLAEGITLSDAAPDAITSPPEASGTAPATARRATLSA